MSHSSASSNSDSSSGRGTTRRSLLATAGATAATLAVPAAAMAHRSPNRPPRLHGPYEPVPTYLQMIKLKPGTEQQNKDFVASLTSGERLELALQAIWNETIYTESIFFETRSDGEYLILHQRIRDAAEASRAFAESDNPVDKEIAEIAAETWVQQTPLLPALTLEVDRVKGDRGRRHRH